MTAPANTLSISTTTFSSTIAPGEQTENFKTAYSSAPDLSLAVKQIQQQLAGLDNQTLILFFASSCYDPAAVSDKMQQAFGGVEVVGCSTAGEITTGRMLDHSIVAMSFSSKVIEKVHVALAHNLSQDSHAVLKACTKLEQHAGRPLQSLDPDHYVGLLFTDGLSAAEERVNEQIGDRTNVTFIGGSAGDDLKFQGTYVYANGKAYTDAALLVLLKPSVKFAFLKTQSFRPTEKVLKVTRLNEARREILEFNDQPATVAYAQALGVPVGELSEHLFKNPLGLMFDEHTPFVRSPLKTENDSVLFYCGMKQGMQLTLLQSTDIIADTALALQKAKEELGGVSAILNFNCILRTLDLKQQHKTQAYGKLFENVPTIGLSTYGENYIGFINQTATMLLFKE